MAIIGIRDLLHASKDILARVENEQEPFLITRHGQPVAALVPVDAAEAERYVLASAPELVESRRRAEAEPAGTRPLREVARKFGVDTEELESDSQQAPVEIVSSLRPFVGMRLAEQYAEEAGERLGLLVQDVLNTAERSGLLEVGSAERAELAERVRAVNGRLLGLEVQTSVRETASERLQELTSAPEAEASAAEEREGDGTFGRSLADAVLDKAVSSVSAVNSRIFSFARQAPQRFSLGAYELSMATGIEMLRDRAPMSDAARRDRSLLSHLGGLEHTYAIGDSYGALGDAVSWGVEVEPSESKPD
jgi:prevent-host-death family protein